MRREVKTLTGSTGAIFSDCEVYRYLLGRVWDDALPTALLLMMNPSTANEVENDPTVERRFKRVMMWPKIGFNFAVGGLEVANAFAFREPDSDELGPLHAAGFDLVGENVDAVILGAARRASVVVCGWSESGTLGGRGQAVLQLLRDIGIKPHPLKLNKDRTPKHPLYVGYKTMPFEIGNEG
ncbi:hypothetical protein ASD15_14350 [Massilia sp. Root351]|jgi:hypothetical protein|uniref:DUF1643 domain-containing protein n=1 Tax=Massilia sp. Root351 TaxID=1736522 RepID=UPI00070EDCB0|nr:DUF1643 domain-containing protein [Massilia sp. Root351]KQV81056.1 hypothetical protein ASD15_14350 [Massilia sp. Root351]